MPQTKLTTRYINSYSNLSELVFAIRLAIEMVIFAVIINLCSKHMAGRKIMV